MNFIALKMLPGDRAKYAWVLGPEWPESGVGRSAERETGGREKE
jgi:hypothetical protein